MDGPPGYSSSHYQDGMNDDEQDHPTHHTSGGSQIGLLGSMDDPVYRPPSTPHRSYHPALSYQDHGSPAAISYSPSQSPVPDYSRPPSRNNGGYIPPASPAISRRGTAAYPPYSPSASRNENRPWTPSSRSEIERSWTPSSRGGGERAWTPSRNGEWNRPPPSSTPYESADIDGSPRPGTPSSILSRYRPASSIGSRGRPLPAAPRFSAIRPPPNRRSVESDETAIPIDGHKDYLYTDDESIFGPEGSTGSLELKRPLSHSGDSFDTDLTATALEDHDNEKPPVTKTTTKGEHFGPAPQAQQTRRGLNRQALMTRKQVKLINGELILECKIPTILYSFLPRRDAVEFTHMRYTAVTCDPDDFTSRGYLLRQNIEITQRETELFVCITMYNEDELNFTRTMHGVMRNIAHFCSRSKSRVWGKDGWQKIVVCIVADGRKKVHPRVLDALAAIGVYQDGIAKNLVNGREVTAHVYEYTTQVSLDSDLKFKGAEKGIVPVQMIFCLKEKNSKKLNSHRWFFNAFGASLNPNVCILLDVGTKPGNTSLYHLWKAFDLDSNVGGACGEIKAMKGRGWMGLFNPLVASQNFEYKMSNILDKPLESVFGYITVLPGALSAYRYHALQNDENGHGPLSQYFKGETLHGKDADVFTANMYLAEDRILCWELVAKRNERWVLKYVRRATGETDVPDTIPEFISQRRRWLNGAFFAATFSLAHFRQIWTTDHTVFRKALLHIEFIYQFFSLIFTFFSLANFYLSFYFIAGSLGSEKLDPFGNGWGARVFLVLKFSCVLLICTQFILCMGNRPQGAKRMFMSSMIAYSIIMAYTTFCACYLIIKSFTGGLPGVKTEIKLGDNLFTNLIVSIGSTMGVYFLMSFLYLDPWHMFTSAFQYFMMLPSYICTLQVYAFCNTHDVSWGTKGDNAISIDLGAAVTSIGKGDLVELEMPSEQLDIDSGYDDALRNLRDRLEVPEEPITESQIKEDYYRAVRTYVVVVWMVANGVLAMVVTEAYRLDDVGQNFYLKILLWSVACLAVFRCIGSSAYLVIQGIHAFAEGRVRFDVKVHINRLTQPSWKRKLKLGGASDLGIA